MKQLLIGTIVNTHGLQGEVKIKPKTHFVEERFAKGKTILLHYSNQELSLKIKSSRMLKDLLLIKFDSYEHINDVEKWKGSELFVNVEDLPKLAEDEIYYHELYDCNVYDENNDCLGSVVEVIETGANAVLRVQNETSSFLVPYVKAFIKEVDSDKKSIVIESIEGML